MIHFVSERVENDVILYINNGENESSSQRMGRNPRFESAMSHSFCTLELDFNLVMSRASTKELLSMRVWSFLHERPIDKFYESVSMRMISAYMYLFQWEIF